MSNASCRRIVVLFLLCASSPWLMAMKCIPKDAAFFPVETEADNGETAGDSEDAYEFSDSDDEASAGEDIFAANDLKVVGQDSDLSVIPSKACSKPGVAKLLIEDTSFNITCGCVEKYSKSCTIATGTIVEWTFYDGEEHNVAGAFGKSGDKISGTWKYQFKVPGTYNYDCSVHVEEMSDYMIIVK